MRKPATLLFSDSSTSMFPMLPYASYSLSTWRPNDLYFLKVNPPKNGLFQTKLWSFGFQVFPTSSFFAPFFVCFFICVHEECLACHFAGQAARRYASDNEQLRAREMLVSSEPLVARASLVAILIRNIDVNLFKMSTIPGFTKMKYPGPSCEWIKLCHRCPVDILSLALCKAAQHGHLSAKMAPLSLEIGHTSREIITKWCFQ